MLTQPAKSPLPLTQLTLNARLSSRHPHQLEVPVLAAEVLACLVSVLTAHTHSSVNHAIHVDGDAERTVSMASRGEADLVCVGTTSGAYVRTYIGEPVNVCTGYYSGGVGGRVHIYQVV